MESFIKTNYDLNTNSKESIFHPENYKFTGSPLKSNQLAKTLVKRKFTPEQLALLTKLHHKNIISLKKIGKSKKAGDEEKFWLYYQAVPYSLEMVLAKNQFDVRPETLQAALVDVKNYLIFGRVTPCFSEANIGANQNGVIKVYIPVESVLKPLQGTRANQQCDKKIKEIKYWYGNMYSRKSIKPPSQIPQTTSGRRLSQSKLNKLVQIKCDIEKIRKKIRSEESKNNSVIGTPQGDKKLKLLYAQAQPNSFTINIYNQVPNSNQKNLEPRQPVQDNEIPRNFQKEPAKYYDYDDQSVDTYQMEMGEDFEMPSMRTNQKLRQTVLNSKKSWDTLTHKSPSNLNKKKKVCESAGTKDFIKIVENNRRMLKQVAQRQNEANSDNKTVQDSHSRQKNWQTSTIKSALPPNIQDRVQQALAKTKNVMQMLKNTKSFSAGK